MRSCALLGLFLAGFVTSAVGQQQEAWDPRRLYASRDSLQLLLNNYELAASSPAYSLTTRDRARMLAAGIRSRLEEGDFRVGDRVVLEVEGEEELTNTFIVETGARLPLPMAGSVSLAHVLRSELEQHLTAHLAEFFRDPVVHARTQIQIAIVGEVAEPGFYVVATEGRLAEVLMQAGGPTRDAILESLRIERENTRVWEGGDLQMAIVEGRTLDQMNIRAGDRIVVPRQRGGLGGAESTVRVVTLALSIPLTIFALVQIF